MTDCNHYWKPTRVGDYRCINCDEIEQPDALVQILSVQIGSGINKIAAMQKRIDELEKSICIFIREDLSGHYIDQEVSKIEDYQDSDAIKLFIKEANNGLSAVYVIVTPVIKVIQHIPNSFGFHCCIDPLSLF